MTHLKLIGMNYDHDVEREGRYFDNLRELAEENYASPNEEFEVDVELVPLTDYYGDERAIVVREGINTLGILSDSDVDEWWPLLCALHNAGEDALVPARIWTSKDWETRFYASVRLDMPTVEEAKEELASDGIELTEENRVAWEDFDNYLVEYWDPNWVAAHGMSKEDVEARAAETAARVDQIMAERSKPAQTAQTSEVGPSPAVELTSTEPAKTPRQSSRLSSGSNPSPRQRKPRKPREPREPREPQVISKPILWLLWFFTGLVGGHRYYLGNLGMGVLQTLTLGGLGVWWLIDAYAMHSRARQLNAGTAPRWTF